MVFFFYGREKKDILKISIKQFRRRFNRSGQGLMETEEEKVSHNDSQVLLSMSSPLNFYFRRDFFFIPFFIIFISTFIVKDK
jgi:hypothetical protein